jgi:DNA transformation protein and related proteins
MAVTDSYKTYVLEQLQGLGSVAARLMFGGVGLYHEGRFFALIDDDTLYFKVDDSNRQDYERAGSTAFRPYGDSYSMHYYEVPADVLDDRPALRDWALKALAVARSSATAKKKRHPPT